MPSPVAHALAGAAVYAALAPRGLPARDWRPWAVAVFAGVAADLDFLPGLLAGAPSRYHHWATHSVAAALAFTLLVTPLVAPVLGSAARRLAILGLAYGSHLGLDVLTVDRTVPRGIPLLWPFSDAAFLAPVPLFIDIHHGASWQAFVNWHNAGAALTEALAIGLPVAVFCALRLRPPAARPGSAIAPRTVSSPAAPTGAAAPTPPSPGGWGGGGGRTR
jgi:inner membrane protein